MSLYVPGHFAARDRATIARLVHDHPFATLVTPDAPEPLVTHLPLLHVADREPHGTLLGHFARANPHARASSAANSIAIFHGPHAYVSPSWYADPAAARSRRGTTPSCTCTARSSSRRMPPKRARSSICMIQRFESARARRPGRLGLDAARLRAMVGAIVGFRIRVKRIDAKLKLSQNRSPDDRARVAAGLDAEGYAEAAATAAWMREWGGGA